ncbi:putative ABC transport system permease protein [Pseudobutyrivibrio sp. YE44]|uniref:ABC transporter permease n=1 Tax=Pseudobutyrivibrio sp. YE44 TaxID=1520802 RepID=UPI00088D8C41|nr:ABC transporter permease [Pseudobutyrivibrio sp. YE44]SDB22849.1 putative ABC transport system permease protein [Pseudobutyrivibrio sp. YE44]
MLITENILLALAGLKSNIMRSLLTMLGIIIGIASVIAIMTVGNSITVMVNTSMQEMGANNLTVGVSQKSTSEETTSSGLHFGPGNRRTMDSDDYLTDEMLDSFLEEYGDNVQYTMLSTSVGNGTATDGSLYANVNITGYNQDYMEYTDLDLLAGRTFIDKDYDNAQKVCIVSNYFVNNMFDGDNQAALGSEIEVSINGKYYTYYIVGVYEYDDSTWSSSSTEDTVTDMYIPFTTARNQLHTNNEGYESITLVTTIDTDSETFADTVEAYFNSMFYSNNEDYEVSVTSMSSMIESMTSMIGTIEVALAIIAGISLVVGGIGVMNIMLVSITERTKEIGTRKALGATNGSIRLQFITESVVICIMGGLIGIILGIGLGAVAATYMGYSASVSVVAIIVAVVFSMAIGIFFGYYPANKAAKLNPIDALRYE